MTTKRIQTVLSIIANDKYSHALKNMTAMTKGFAGGVRTELSSLQGIRGPLRLIDDFKAAQKKVGEVSRDLAAARERLRDAQNRLNAGGKVTDQMRREFERARGSVERLTQAHERQRRKLGQIRTDLGAAGVNTSDLAGEQQRLAGSVDRVTTAMGRQIEKMDRIETMQARLVKSRERMDRALATSANLSLAGNASAQTGRRILTSLSAPVQSAVQFESSMSDVRKVVDFQTPEPFKQMSDDVLELSTRIPMAADGLAQIVAAGAQSGVSQGQLLSFAEAAAKIGVAFDVSADDAGTSMAKIKTALGLTLEQTQLVFDGINHLSNNMASTAPEVLNFTTRVAVDGEVKGFSPTETMAFGSAMIASGAEAEVAATSFRNMGKALVRGEGVTDRQAMAYERLGLSSKAVAKSMQDDAVETTLDVMERIQKLPAEVRSSIISDLFGDEARALAPLINNIDLLRDALGLVAEEQQYAGSAEREYAERSKTTANNLQLMRNQMTRLGVTVGEVVLPPLNDFLEVAGRAVEHVVAWAKAHPGLTKGLVIGAAGLGAFAVAGGAVLTAAGGIIGTLAVLRFGLAGLGTRAAFAAGEFGGVGLAIKTLPKLRLASLVTPLIWTSRLIPVIGWSILAGTLAWKFLIKPLGWDKFVPSVDWSSLVGSIDWRDGIPVVNWSQFVSAFDWRDGVPSLKWAGLITPLALPLFIGKFHWSAVINNLSWRSYVSSFDPIGAVKRMNWAERVQSLDWAKYVPGFQLVDRLGKLFWYNVIDKLDWKDRIPNIEWASWFDFQWANILPTWVWDFIPSIQWGDKFSFDWSDLLPTWTWDFIPSFDLGSKLRWPSPPSWLSKVIGGGSDPATAPKPAGARAGGGPVHMGLPYLVNENTARSEWFVPSASGGILNVSQAQSVFRSVLARGVQPNPDLARLNRGAQGVRAAGLALVTGSALVGPVAAQERAQTVKPNAITVQIENFTVQVPSGVSDPEAIADLVSERIGQRVAATIAASFSD